MKRNYLLYIDDILHSIGKCGKLGRLSYGRAGGIHNANANA
jgi:hypothetical protein